MASVGSQLITPFNAASRGANRGKNDHGIPITFLLLSMEPNSYDSSVNSTASANGFTLRGLDALPNRTSGVRAGVSFFNGIPASTTPASLSSANRRQIVILNGVRNSPGKSFLQILVNDHPDGALSTSEGTAMRAAINSVMPAPADPYAAWATAQGLTAANSAADADPDHDTLTNLQEYFHGTPPLSPGPGPAIELLSGVPYFTFRRSPTASFQPWSLETGAQTSGLTPWTPAAADITAIPSGDAELIRVRLPIQSRWFVRLRISR